MRPAPDMDRMNEGAGFLIGKQDFSSFCRTQSETENRMCTVETAYWQAVPDRAGAMDFVIRADRFLHGMVRAIVGTLVDVGHGKRFPESISEILAATNRVEAGFAAPPHGLMLEHVSYPGDSPAKSNGLG